MFNSNNQAPEKLTLTDLVGDEVGNDIGYWSRDIKIRGKRLRLIICKTSRGYLIANGFGPSILGDVKTVEDAVLFYNNFVDKLYSHDVVVLQSQTKTTVLAVR